MTIIYLAGPYNAPTQLVREWNTVDAERAADTVFSHGAIPVFTHRSYHNFSGRWDEALFIQAGLALLRICDAVWCYAGHSASMLSPGTRGEIAEAERLGLPVGYDLPALLRKCA